ncbi:MAG: tetratricopeptide repeat protein [Bacteroidetes bacterium]|nr:tetratricopeptide repeat protein [Bacteroidota bacterium]
MSGIKTSYCYILITIVTLVVFYNTFQNDFVFDDESVVQNNQSITSLSNIPKYFTGEEGFHKVIGKYYRPVVSATYAIDYALYGLSPKGFHVTNVIIHLIACLLLFKVFSLLFAKSKYGNFISLIAALLFVVHPVHTEAVSWISGRTDSIVTLFFFASFLYYIKFSDSKYSSSKYLILSLVFYFIGLLSKEMIVTMPVIILLYDFVYLKRPLSSLKENIKPYLLFFGVTGLYVLIRYFALKDVPDRMNYMYFVGKDASVVFLTMLKTIPVYFKLLVYPVNLLYHYNGVMPDAVSFDLNVILSLVFIAGMIICAILLFRKQSKISFVILFFLITLLPVMNIVPTMNFMAERFLYLTSFCLSLCIAVVLANYFSEKNKQAVLIVSILVLVVLSFLTIKRNAEWKTNDILYSTADGVDGNVLLVNAGNIYANNKNYDEAAKRYRRAIEIRDNALLAHHNLGLIYMIKGNLDSAEIKLKKGISIDSLAPDGYFQLAQVYQMKKQNDDAVKMLEKLQTIAPDYKQSQSLLAALKMRTPDNTQGIQENTANPNAPGMNFPNQDVMQIVQQKEKSSFDNYSNKKYREAIKDLEELIEMNPALKSGYQNNIGMCYQELKDYKSALKYFNEAVKSDPKSLNALSGASETYLLLGDKSKASETFKEILKLYPDNQYAKNKIDSLKKVK